MFNYTFAWNNDADFRRHRSFAERVLLGNRLYQPDHSFMGNRALIPSGLVCGVRQIGKREQST
jgi:hypothetical protein